MRTEKIGLGTFSKGKLLIKIEKPGVVMASKNIWIKDIEETSLTGKIRNFFSRNKKLIVEADVEEIQDSKEPGGIDLIKLADSTHIIEILKEATRIKPNAQLNTQEFVALALNVSVAISESLKYLMKNKNYFVFKDYLNRNNEIDSVVKEVIIANLEDVKDQLGASL